MENLIQTIRVALAADASDEIKAAGVAACRSILGAIEPIRTPTVEPIPAAPNSIAAIVTALRGLPADQLLDLAIARLRSALPPGTTVSAVKPISFQVIPAPLHLVPRGTK